MKSSKMIDAEKKIEELEAELKKAKSDLEYKRGTEASYRAEIEEAHRLLDLIPNPIVRERESTKNSYPTTITYSVSQRLMAWLLQKVEK